MRSFLAFFLFLIIGSSVALADAWTLPEGKITTSDGIYIYADGARSHANYSFLQPNNSRINLHQSSKLIKYSQTNDINYGLSDRITLITKADFSKVKNDIAFNIEPLGEEVKLTENINTFNGQIGFRTLLGKSTDRSMSFSFSYITGELPISERNTLIAFEPQAVEAKLSYGHAFNSCLLFQQCDKNIYHYFEWQAASKYYLEQKTFSHDFNLQLGVRPSQKTLFVVGLLNRVNINTSNKRYRNTQALIDKFGLNDVPGLTSSQVTNMVNQVFTKENIYNVHQLQLKFSYEVSKNKYLSIEDIFSVSSQVPYTGNLIKVSFEVNF